MQILYYKLKKNNKDAQWSRFKHLKNSRSALEIRLSMTPCFQYFNCVFGVLGVAANTFKKFKNSFRILNMLGVFKFCFYLVLHSNKRFLNLFY